MPLEDRLTTLLSGRFLHGLFASPAGRAFLLNQAADAEGTDEGAIFDRLLRHVEDPALRKMIERHRADELRHEALLRACIARTGVVPAPVPPHLRLLDRLDQKLGGLMQQPVRDDRDVMMSYLVLLVIEERALNQFALFIPAFERVDPETAAVFREIARDEERHLRYCYAISKRYAPGEATWAAHLDHLRAIEAKAFSETSRDVSRHVFEAGLHGAGPIEQWAWRTVQGLVARGGNGQRTRFWGTHAPAAA